MLFFFFLNTVTTTLQLTVIQWEITHTDANLTLLMNIYWCMWYTIFTDAIHTATDRVSHDYDMNTSKVQVKLKWFGCVICSQTIEFTHKNYTYLEHFALRVTMIEWNFPSFSYTNLFLITSYRVGGEFVIHTDVQSSTPVMCWSVPVQVHRLTPSY